MSGVDIRQRAASEDQMGSRRGQEGRPAPLHRARWSTVFFDQLRAVTARISASEFLIPCGDWPCRL